MKDGSRSRLTNVLMIVVILGAAWLRFYGINWDEGYLFHPDERQVLMLVDDISLPVEQRELDLSTLELGNLSLDRTIEYPWISDWAILLTPKSPANPGFFAYGSMPIYLLRILADIAGLFDPRLADLHSIHLVARALSALFDLGTIYVLYLLGKRLHNAWTGLLAATLCALTVLHIQLSHFYAVDTVLTFFVVLTLYEATALLDGLPKMRPALDIGVAMGLALATKISAAPLAIPIALAWWSSVKRASRLPEYPQGHTMTRWWRMIVGTVLTGLVALVTFVIFEPYALIDPVQFVIDVISEGQMAQGLADIPYTRQFIGTLPYIYPLVQTVLWTMGPMLGILGWGSLMAGIVVAAEAAAKRMWPRFGKVIVPLSWALVYFGLVGGFHAKFLRYMLPIAPILCLGAAWIVTTLLGRKRWLRAAGCVLAVLALAVTGIYAVGYTHIYTQPHTWVQATGWLCRNLPRPRKIMVEHWDDPLPLIQGTNELRCYRSHYMFSFPAYDMDTQAKVNALCETLEMCDYVVLSTNRLYNTIPRLPQRYPATSQYYEMLMAGDLGYDLVYMATSYPQLGEWRWVDDTFSNPELPIPEMVVQERAAYRNIMPGRADESYSVYDHPMPLVFQNTGKLSYDELYGLFDDVLADLPERKP